MLYNALHTQRDGAHHAKVALLPAALTATTTVRFVHGAVPLLLCNEYTVVHVLAHYSLERPHDSNSIVHC